MSITHGLRRALQINADGTAMLFGEHRRTWSDVGERVARLAAALNELGCTQGERVAVLMLNQARYLELYFAAAWAGGVIVPVNTRWSEMEIEDSLRDCRPAVLVVDDTFAGMGARIAQRLGAMKLVHADDGKTPSGVAGYEALIEAAAPVPDAMRGSDDLAGIFYTGGTTGRSKGVMLSHRNLMANAFNALAEGLFSGESIYLHAAPMFHLANGAAMYSLMLSGGTNVLIRGFAPEPVMQAIERYRVNEILLVPTMIQMLVDHPAISSYDLSSLQRIVFGASPMSEALLDRAMTALPNAKFVQAYGMTELSPIATILHHHEQTGVGRARADDTGQRDAPRSGSRSALQEPTTKQCHWAPWVKSASAATWSCKVTGSGRQRPQEPSSMAGCTPATAATWTKTASSMWSTGSRT